MDGWTNGNGRLLLDLVVYLLWRPLQEAGRRTQARRLSYWPDDGGERQPERQDRRASVSQLEPLSSVLSASVSDGLSIDVSGIEARVEADTS